MTKCELYYLAGIIDGEGCVTINYNRKRNTYSLRFTVSSTDRILVDWLKEKLGGNYYLRKKQEKWHREKYEWIMHAYQPQRQIVKELINKVIIKRKQLELANNFLKLSGIRGISDKRARIREQIMLANARGRTTE